MESEARLPMLRIREGVVGGKRGSRRRVRCVVNVMFVVRRRLM